MADLPAIEPYTLKVMSLAVLGASAMWLGYWSQIASRITKGSNVRRFRAMFLARSSRPRPLAIPAMVAASEAARFMLLGEGAYGYSSNHERLVELAGVTEYLRLLSKFGALALALAALQVFQRRAGAPEILQLVVVFALELGWGTLSGFKWQILLPFVVVGVCYYLAKGRIPTFALIVSVVLIPVSYSVVEPFRAERNLEGSGTSTALGDIFGMYAQSRDQQASFGFSAQEILLRFLGRVNITEEGAAGIRFADSGSLTEDDPAFLRNVLLSPAYAVVPRMFWESKPLETKGLWYHQVVMGRSSVSAEAMGTVTYLYFAGGAVGVMLGFAFLGLLQRVTYCLLQPWASGPGVVVFMALLVRFGNAETHFDSFLISLIREAPLLLCLPYILFSPKSRLPQDVPLASNRTCLIVRHS
jgi:hypothetical protein